MATIEVILRMRETMTDESGEVKVVTVEDVAKECVAIFQSGRPQAQTEMKLPRGNIPPDNRYFRTTLTEEEATRLETVYADIGATTLELVQVQWPIVTTDIDGNEVTTYPDEPTWTVDILDENGAVVGERTAYVPRRAR